MLLYKKNILTNVGPSHKSMLSESSQHTTKHLSLGGVVQARLVLVGRGQVRQAREQGSQILRRKHICKIYKYEKWMRYNAYVETRHI
jgi:hypothetical protein